MLADTRVNATLAVSSEVLERTEAEINRELSGEEEEEELKRMAIQTIRRLKNMTTAQELAVERDWVVTSRVTAKSRVWSHLRHSYHH